MEADFGLGMSDRVLMWRRAIQVEGEWRETERPSEAERGYMGAGRAARNRAGDVQATCATAR